MAPQFLAQNEQASSSGEVHLVLDQPSLVFYSGDLDFEGHLGTWGAFIYFADFPGQFLHNVEPIAGPSGTNHFEEAHYLPAGTYDLTWSSYLGWGSSGSISYTIDVRVPEPESLASWATLVLVGALLTGGFLTSRQ